MNAFRIWRRFSFLWHMDELFKLNLPFSEKGGNNNHSEEAQGKKKKVLGSCSSSGNEITSPLPDPSARSDLLLA
jgi:hypothetical protein